MKKQLLTLVMAIFGSAAFAQSWTEQNTGFSTASRGISEIRIVNTNTVWALAYDGVTPTANIQEFTTTGDGGTTWTAGVIDLGDPTLKLTNITAFSPTTAWVGAFNETTGIGGVWKTEDTGATWTQQNSSAFQTNGESWFNVVHFFDANNGVAMGDPEGGEFEVYTTNDGGDNWTRVPAASLPDPLSGEYGYNGGYVTAGNTFWFVTNKGKIYRTTDMGATWSKFNSPISDFGSTAVNGKMYFSNNTNGVLLRNGATNNFYSTTDGGATWSAASTFTGTRKVLSYIPNTSTIVATSSVNGSTGTDFSSNNGATWTNIENGGPQRGFVAFIDGSTGWCGGFNTDATTGGIYKFDGNLGTEDFSSNKSAIYPNPTNGLVTIALATAETFEAKVMDINGKVLLTKTFNGLENNLMDVSSLSSGVYMMELKFADKKEVKKLVKN